MKNPNIGKHYLDYFVLSLYRNIRISRIRYTYCKDDECSKNILMHLSLR